MPGEHVPFTLEQIRAFWSGQAKAHGQNSAASWSDFRVMEMEVREILPRLADGDRVLDVGCASGYSTIQFAAQRKIQVLGVDYIPEMIENARARLSTVAPSLRGCVEFARGDITGLSEPDGFYD